MASRMIQNNFSGGEISPSLYGRSDLQAYYKGCAVAENFVISKEGTLRKRKGLRSVMTLEGEYAECKIFPYKYDRSEGGFFLARLISESTVRIEFYSKLGVKRSWTEDSRTVDHRDITGFAGSVNEIQSKQIGDEIWITNGKTHRIISVKSRSSGGALTWSFDISEWSQVGVPESIPFSSKSTSTHENRNFWKLTRSSTPGTDDSTRKLYYGIICVKDGVNSKTTTGKTTWFATWPAGQSVTITLQVNRYDCEEAKWDRIIVGKRLGGNYGDIASVYTTDEPDWYVSAYQGYYYTSTGGRSTIAAWTKLYKIVGEDDSVTYNTKEDGSGHEWQCDEIPEPEYCVYEVIDENNVPTDIVYDQTNVLGDDFTTPLCVDCFQQRRVFANATNASGKLPMTLWFSEVGNINNFYANRPSQADDAFSPTIGTDGPAFIRFIVSYAEYMVILTDSGLFAVGFSEQQGFSSTTCRISKFSNLSCSPNVQPVVSEAGVVFVGADNRTIYSIAYDLQRNKLHAVNRSVLVEHLTRTSRITSIAIQDYPDNVIWVRTSDGKVCTFTIESDESVYSWAHSKIEGMEILDVIGLGTCTDPDTTRPYDDRTTSDVLFVVKRDGAYYVCAFDNAGYVDSVDGVEKTVVARMVTLRPESQERTIVGMKKNVKDMLIRLYNSGGLMVRSPDKGDMPFVERSPETIPFSGDLKVMPRGVVNEDGQIEVKSEDGHPCEILQLVTTVEVE